VYSSPYRDGESTGLACITELLRAGTSNYYRLQATVNQDRYLELVEEPRPGEADYSIDAEGRIWDSYGAQVWPETPPYGAWLAVKELSDPLTTEIGIVDTGRVFIEEVTWQNGKLRWKFRGQSSLLDGLDD
jgi:hypothetical protein